MFVRDPKTNDDVWLCDTSGKLNLGTDWAGIVADYKAAGVPLVVHDRATLLARFGSGLPEAPTSLSVTGG